MTKPKMTRFTHTIASALIIGALHVGIGNAAGTHSGGQRETSAVERSGGHGHANVFGAPGNPAKADRTIQIIMTDTQFSIPALTVKAGETIRFVIRNKGRFLHEFNIGTPHMHADHQKEMIKMFEHGMMTATSMNHQMVGMDHSEMEMKGMTHDDPNSVLVEPGKTAELTWIFRKSDRLEFACNVPGHYQLGMVGEINVTGDPDV